MLCFWVCKRWWHACHEDTAGNGVIAPLSVNLGTRWRRVTSVMLLPTYHKKRTAVSIKYEVGCIPGPVWICLEMEKSLSRIWIAICSPVPIPTTLHWPLQLGIWFPTISRIGVVSFSWVNLPLKVKRSHFFTIVVKYTTNSTVSHPKGPKSLPMPLWKPQISQIPILPKFYHNCLFNTLEVKCQIFVCFWHNSPQWARASSFTRFLDHTRRSTTVSRTPLDEWSACRRDL